MKTSHRAVFSEHCAMVVMAFLPRVHPTDEKANLSPFGYHPWMRENVNKGVLFLWADAVVRFALETGVENIVV